MLNSHCDYKCSLEITIMWIVAIRGEGGSFEPFGPFNKLEGQNGAEEWLEKKGYEKDLGGYWKKGATGRADIRKLNLPD